MSTVRVNDKIKEQVAPILADLGLSLSEAINIFLHQVKMNNGIPFEVKRKAISDLEDYECEYGCIHNYGKLELADIEKEAEYNKTYDNAKEMIEDILKED